MAEPCVKGTLFRNLADEILELMADGRLDDTQVQKLLGTDERETLEGEICISTWYPIELYGRMLELYANGVGGDADAAMIESGRRSARRVIELGIYSQLDDRTRECWENRIGRILVTLSGSFFNFGRWQWRGLQGDGFTILVSGAGPMTRGHMLRTAGFIEQLAERAAGAPIVLGRERSADGQELTYHARRLG